MTRLFLMTHGATEQPQPPRLEGRRIDPPLSRPGVQAALHAAHALRGEPLAALYTSPLRRCVQTGQIVGNLLRVQQSVAEGLIECHRGRWEGLDWQAVRYFDAAHYHRFQREPSHTAYPQGESYAEAQARAIAQVEPLLERHAGESILLISHLAIVRLVLAGRFDTPLTPDELLSLQSGGIVRLDLNTQTAQVHWICPNRDSQRLVA